MKLIIYAINLIVYALTANEIYNKLNNQYNHNLSIITEVPPPPPLQIPASPNFLLFLPKILIKLKMILAPLTLFSLF